MKTLLSQWNFMRVLRLSLAIIITAQGIIARDMLTIVLGLAFGAMAAANISCCGSGSCAVSQRTKSIKPEDVQYEEVVSK
jgi:hypothetical protein